MLKTLKYWVSGPRKILVLFLVGWGPQFAAEVAWAILSDKAANFRPQAFAMAWMVITVVCTLLAIALSVFYLVRHFLGGSENDTPGGLGL